MSIPILKIDGVSSESCGGRDKREDTAAFLPVHWARRSIWNSPYLYRSRSCRAWLLYRQSPESGSNNSDLRISDTAACLPPFSYGRRRPGLLSANLPAAVSGDTGMCPGRNRRKRTLYRPSERSALLCSPASANVIVTNQNCHCQYQPIHACAWYLYRIFSSRPIGSFSFSPLLYYRFKFPTQDAWCK